MENQVQLPVLSVLSVQFENHDHDDHNYNDDSNEHDRG